MIVHWHAIQDPDWPCYVAATDRGLCGISLPGEPLSQFKQSLEKKIPDVTWLEDDEFLRPYSQEILEYLQKKRTHFTFALDIYGTTFQIKVWSALQTIPYGTTVSYAEIAKAISQPAAVRAVGLANGQNPIPIVIPCHRVIGKNGALTGYRGGLRLKVQLLRLEGLPL